MTLQLLKLSADLFQSTNPNASNLINFLTKIINEGYDYNKKYNIITAPRIKNEKMFINDLGFKEPQNFILVLLKSKDTENKDITEEALKSLKIEAVNSSFNFTSISQDLVLGSIGIKTVPDSLEKGWELTGVVSNYKGVGKYLVNKITDIAKDSNQDYLLCSVITEHGLLSYYEKFGFIEFGERILQKIDENGRVIGGSLEDGLYANQDFHVGFLKKQL